jgi:hypothetical protein
VIAESKVREVFNKQEPPEAESVDKFRERLR